MNREGTQRLTEWSPSRFFNSDRPSHPFALILLNQPLNWTAFEKIFGSGRLLSQHSPHPDKIVLTPRTQRHLQSALMGVLTGSIWSRLAPPSAQTVSDAVYVESVQFYLGEASVERAAYL